MKVRIALAVDADGDWFADGCVGQSDASMRDVCGCCMRVVATYWVEAEIPDPVTPPSPTIQGTVSDGD